MCAPAVHAEDFGLLVADSQAAASANRTTINAALAASAGIGAMLLPAGTYFVANNAGASAISSSANRVALWGMGIGRTTLKLADGANDHLIDFSGDDCEIAYLTIHGNRANQTSKVHGLRLSGERHSVHDCLIEETAHYGLGLGQAAGTALRHATFRNLHIRNTGGDAIDLKNRLSTNVGNRFESIIIENYDLAGNTGQAGLDIRGHATVEGLWVFTANAPASGSHLRFRDDATTTGSATNCHFAAGTTGVGLITSAVSIGAAALDVALTNILSVGFSRAFAISGGRASLTNCRSFDADDVGFYTRDGVNQTLINCTAIGASTGFNLEGDEAQLLGCRAVDCTTTGIRVAGDRNEIASCRLDSATGNGVLIITSAEDTRIHDTDFTQHGGADIADTGTRTLAWDNPGADPVGDLSSTSFAAKIRRRSRAARR